jgi:putative addiction module killer protein
VYEIIKSSLFERWFASLKDRQARARIQMRIDRAEDGNLGDIKPVGDGVSEMRIAYGPGYRVYFIRRKQTVIILLCAGDKSTQRRDIIVAKTIAETWES